MTQGFDVKIVALPKGTDPADDPAAFERYLLSPVSYPVHRVRLLHERASDKTRRASAIQTFLNSLPDSPEHQDAPTPRRRSSRPAAGDAGRVRADPDAARAQRRVISPRLLDAGSRLERGALAGVAAHPKLSATSRSSAPSTSTTSCTGAPARSCSARPSRTAT